MKILIANDDVPEVRDNDIVIHISSRKHHLGNTAIAVVIAEALQQGLGASKEIVVLNNDGDFSNRQLEFDMRQDSQSGRNELLQACTTAVSRIFIVDDGVARPPVNLRPVKTRHQPPTTKVITCYPRLTRETRKWFAHIWSQMEDGEIVIGRTVIDENPGKVPYYEIGALPFGETIPLLNLVGDRPKCPISGLQFGRVYYRDESGKMVDEVIAPEAVVVAVESTPASGFVKTYHVESPVGRLQVQLNAVSGEYAAIAPQSEKSLGLMVGLNFSSEFT